MNNHKGLHGHHIEGQGHREQPVHNIGDLVAAICLLASDLRNCHVEITKAVDWFKSQSSAATKSDLIKLQEVIMASQAELTSELRQAVGQLTKIGAEIAGVQAAVNTANTKITDLEAVIAQGGAVDQELVNAVAEVKTAVQAVDDQIPDAPVVPAPVL